MELETLELLAFGDDRGPKAAGLIEGTSDFDYFRAIRLQQKGDYAAVDKILEQWSHLHGDNEQLEILQRRQTLLRWMAAPTSANAIAATCKLVGEEHLYQPKGVASEVALLSSLDDRTWSDQAAIAQILSSDSSFSYITDEAIAPLLGCSLTSYQRQSLLARVQRPVQGSGLFTQVVAELREQGVDRFGHGRFYQLLSLEQLGELARTYPKLASNWNWIAAKFVRHAPGRFNQRPKASEQRSAWLRELLTEAERLPIRHPALEKLLLGQWLDNEHAALRFAPAEFTRWLTLHRQTVGASAPDWQAFSTIQAQLKLESIGDDELIERSLQAAVRDNCVLAVWEPVLGNQRMAEMVARYHVLAGKDTAAHQRTLGSTALIALAKTVVLRFSDDQATEFADNAAVCISLVAKHVATITARIYRIDLESYFVSKKTPFDHSIDLDGVVANAEVVLECKQAPAIEHRVRLELDYCAQPGTYVVDIVGGGLASRAVLYKGGIAAISQPHVDGTELVAYSGSGETLQPCVSFSALIDGRWFASDAHGKLVVPYIHEQRQTFALIRSGESQSIIEITLYALQASLEATVWLANEQLSRGKTVEAAVHFAVAVNGLPIPLGYINSPRCLLTLTSSDGDSSNREYPLSSEPGKSTVIAWSTPERCSQVDFEVVADITGPDGRTTTLRHRETRVLALAATHQNPSDPVVDLFLRYDGERATVVCLGRNGEALKQRPMRVSIMHRFSRQAHVTEVQSDDHGTVNLGSVLNLQAIYVTCGGLSRQWTLQRNQLLTRTAVIREAERLTLPLAAVDGAHWLQCTARAEREQPLASLAKMSGANVVAYLPLSLTIADHQLVLPQLAAGNYRLQFHDRSIAAQPIDFEVWPSSTRLINGNLVSRDYIARNEEFPPLISKIKTASDGEKLVIHIARWSDSATITALASQFAFDHSYEHVTANVNATIEETQNTANSFVNGRELGDEIRYVIERKTQPAQSATLVTKPSLLIHPWQRRTTANFAQEPLAGGGFMGAPAPASPRPNSRTASPKRREAEIQPILPSDPSFCADSRALMTNLPAQVSTNEVIVELPIAGIAAGQIEIIVSNCAGSMAVKHYLTATSVRVRELLLTTGFAADRHIAELRQIQAARASTVQLPDPATAKYRVVDTVGKLHGYLLALTSNDELKHFSFITTWDQTSNEEKLRLYLEYGCNELNLFLFTKDRSFFDAVVQPVLASKLSPSLVDRWLLGWPLDRYLQAHELRRLNACELALLAMSSQDKSIAHLIADKLGALGPESNPQRRVAIMLAGAALEEDTFAASDSLAGMAMSAAEPLYESESASDDSYEPEEQKRSSRSRADTGSFPKKMKAMSLGQQAPQVFRNVDKTAELAERRWWKETPGLESSELIRANEFWLALAKCSHAECMDFLHIAVGQCSESFAAAMAALAFTSLPFRASQPTISKRDNSLCIAVPDRALVASSALLACEAPQSTAISVSQQVAPLSNRTTWVNNEWVEVNVTGPLVAGTAYVSSVVVANLSSTRIRGELLFQIPQGALSLSATNTERFPVEIEPYAAARFEATWYFPRSGTFGQFAPHCTANGVILGFSQAREWNVLADHATASLGDWHDLANRAPLAEVVAFLEGEPFAPHHHIADLAWRCKAANGYRAIVAALAKRRFYCAEIWSFAILHGDVPRAVEWLRQRIENDSIDLGPAFDATQWNEKFSALSVDQHDLVRYEHLEYAPLVLARAHRLGSKREITNDGLLQQVKAFLAIAAHRTTVADDDLLAWATYLLALDRFTEAKATLGRIDRSRVTATIQLACIDAYVALLDGDTARASQAIAPWQQLAHPRWQARIAEIAATLQTFALAQTEPANSVALPVGVGGAEPNRNAQLDQLAKRSERLELEVSQQGFSVRSNASSVNVRMFFVDAELLFSKEPFASVSADQFAVVAPAISVEVQREELGTLRPWPTLAVGKNIVVQAVTSEARVSKIYYANDLIVHVANSAGRLQVCLRSSGKPRRAAYVKVYGRRRPGSGHPAFYKDGYTDLAGWFDYATLSTDDLDRTGDFSILVVDSEAGAIVTAASPPLR